MIHQVPSLIVFLVADPESLLVLVDPGTRMEVADRAEWLARASSASEIVAVVVRTVSLSSALVEQAL